MNRYVIRFGSDLFYTHFTMVTPSLSMPNLTAVYSQVKRFPFRIAADIASRLNHAGYLCKVVVFCE